MSKVAVVYWSGTGNTEMMAQKVAEGAKEAGAEVAVLTSADFSADDVDAYDAIAFGCPAMGAEELEDTEFEPMFSACESKLSGKKIALFGSYGWGDGEWMRTWEETCKNDGADLVCDSVICADAPDDEADAACAALEKRSAKAEKREKGGVQPGKTGVRLVFLIHRKLLGIFLLTKSSTERLREYISGYN